MKRVLTTTLVALALAFSCASSASAAASFGFTEAAHELSSLAPGTINRGDEYVGYLVKLKNTGNVKSSTGANVTISLPDGLKMATGSGEGWVCHPVASTCSSTKEVEPGAEYPKLKIAVWIFPDAPATVNAGFFAYGGGTAFDAFASDAFSFGPAVGFGIGSLLAGACSEPPAAQAELRSCLEAEGKGSLSYDTAGGHPFAASTSMDFARHVSPLGSAAVVESLRDLFVDLPAGFLGNPQAINAICTVNDVKSNTLVAPTCPESAAVGGISVEPEGFPSERTAIYRVVPEQGYVAAFAFIPSDLAGPNVYVIRAKVRSNGDYGVSAVAPLAPQSPALLSIRYATLCGYGAKLTTSGSHIPLFIGCKHPGTAGANTVPFLTNPTYCGGGEPVTTATIDSYEHPGAQSIEDFPLMSDSNWKVASTKSPEIIGCNQLEFEPTFEGRPTTNVADAPSGLDFSLHLPQSGLVSPLGLAQAHLKEATVVLPVGMSVNPAAAAGLQACSSAQIGLVTPVGQTPAHFSTLPDSCPPAAKLGTIELRTPLLDKPLLGSLYLAKQYDNPFDSLLALYISINEPETGIVAKLAGKVTPDPSTGQLTTSFAENPQVPFEDLELHVFEGARASLRTPATCGIKTTSAIFSPWSAPESGPPAQRSDSFETTTAPGGGHCSTGVSELPNAPRFSAGTITPRAGAYSPFLLRLAREDGSQEIKGLNASLPPGLTGRLAGTARCSEAQIARAKARSKPGEGVLEQANPSCPASSEVGSVDVGAGAGPAPYHATGKAYLAGPYKGAPISLIVITPAVAGPFDLGAVVVRNALYVNPTTTQVSVKSDPIPTIIEGIPLDVRSIEVRVTRDQFTLNPTSCEPMSISATAFAASSDASLAQRFQVGECESLVFAPKLALRLKGSTKRGAYQRLTATVTAKPGEANIARAAVTLPHSSFLAQEHIRTICTRVQFAARQCPEGSIYGRATAITPLLDEPLSGSVYLRSSNNPLPDLVAALRGPDSTPIEVELAGRTDSKDGGIRNTFDLVPDAPVSKFTLQLLGGKKSLIVNSRNLCKGIQRATVRLAAHNGMTYNSRPAVGNDCGKKGKGKKGGSSSKRASLLFEAW